jgi:integrase
LAKIVREEKGLNHQISPAVRNWELDRSADAGGVCLLFELVRSKLSTPHTLRHSFATHLR